ncbi:PhoX family protein [Gramella sp. GC03-9]|uniref:PhoX family protein n=1 Tax=Christiangramia oceanisediminis TaxID=2920386 RepID=A0A9X2KZU5_9FLAO|nr:PhoX family protein [Gramella oceanisediminis]MCP9201282.1 PhoX family protein [Gramella oceanisediminis]
MKSNLSILALAGLICFTSCTEDQSAFEETSADLKLKGIRPEMAPLKAYSETPSFLKIEPQFRRVKAYPILSSEDVLPTTGKNTDFIYGSMADGAGLLRNPDGTFTLINNIEADFSVARIQLDAGLKPISGEYILNATATGNVAQCSGTLVTEENGFFSPVYLSGGEWSISGNPGKVFQLDPNKDAANASTADIINGMGQWTVENAVPIGRDAYPGKTVTFIGDDDSSGDEPSGQLGMYVSDAGSFNNGKLYGLKVPGFEVGQEAEMLEGQSYDMEFVELTGQTLEELEMEADAKGVMGFTRLEDIDWRRGSAKNQREIYFCVTGRRDSDFTDDAATIYGRVYKLELNENDPTAPGKITCVLDGDNLEGEAKTFLSPDNIVVTENYAYIQEDPNYGNDPNPLKNHFARLYQYDLETGKLRTVLECDQELAASMGYGTTDNTWEITGMIDISETVGVKDMFLLITQNHGWEDASFTDTSTNAAYSNEGSQLYVLKGLDR